MRYEDNEKISINKYAKRICCRLIPRKLAFREAKRFKNWLKRMEKLRIERTWMLWMVEDFEANQKQKPYTFVNRAPQLNKVS